MAHACGVSVEGEIGCLGSLETGQAGEEDGVGAEGVLDHSQLLTRPEEAAQFCERHRCGCPGHCHWHLARRLQVHPPAHRRHPGHRPRQGNPRPHSQHASGDARFQSRVPQDWLAIINEFGGDIKETYGVPVEQIVEAIKHGVRKVNIDTDLRLASTGAIRRFLAENPAEFDPRKYFAKTITAMRDICIARYEAFGAAGQASKIKGVSLEAMSDRYAKGLLVPKVN
jgi:fructose-bisphosphate aldolase class II